jgi:hypothetical protein
MEESLDRTRSDLGIGINIEYRNVELGVFIIFEVLKNLVNGLRFFFNDFRVI